MRPSGAPASGDDGADGAPVRERAALWEAVHRPRARCCLRFALGSAAAIAVAVVGGYFALRSVAIDEAKRETRTKVQEAAQLVESTLDDGLVAGEPAAREAIDDVVVARVLNDSIVRVKIWSADGRVLYSDDPAQIGGRYALDAGQLRLLREGGAKVEVSDLDRPENALDRGQGELIEAYTRIRTPSGTPVLFEIYQRFGSVTASARRLLAALAPPILGAIGLIVLIQAPLLWSLTRRLQRGHEEREALLGERGRGVGAGTPPRRLVSSRRAGAGHRRPRLLARAAGRRGSCTRGERRGGRAADDDRPSSPHRPRPARAARRAPPAASRGGGARGRDRRPRQPAPGERRARVGCDRRSRAARPRAGGARLSRRAGGRAERDRVRGRRTRCGSS